MTGARLSIDVSGDPANVRVRLTGEIDISTADRLRAAVAEVLAGSPARLVLSFAEVSFCDSQGLSTLITIGRQAESAGTVLTLTDLGEFVGRLLEISGLRGIFRIEPIAG